MGTDDDRHAFYRSVSQFLMDLNSVSPGQTLRPVDNLFDLGYLDSAVVVELLVFLEDSLSMDIPVETLDPRSFHTLEGMYDALCL